MGEGVVPPNDSVQVRPGPAGRGRLSTPVSHLQDPDDAENCLKE